MRFIIVSATLAGCATAPAAPHAVVTATTGAREQAGTILVLRTVQDAAGKLACDTEPATSRFAAPMLLLKLQLAGYTIVDAETLKLDNAEREEITHDGGTEVSHTIEHVSDVATVADLPGEQQAQIAHENGFAGVLRTTVTSVFDEQCNAPDRMELRAELVMDERTLWTVTCSDSSIGLDPLATLSTCAGDGILAWRAPDAIARRL